MATQKPSLAETDIWARSADPGDIEKPIQDLINQGFLYGEKPPHEGHNYYWKLFSQYLMHLNQNGVGEWDINTTYNQGALSKDGTMIYFALADNTGIQPSTDPATWNVAFSSKAPDADRLDGMEPHELPIPDAVQTALDTKLEADAIADMIVSDISTIGSKVVNEIIVTQSEYDSITPDASTIYNIVG